MSFVAQRYQTAQVETASPVRIVVLLHDGAVRAIQQALHLTRSGQIATRGNAIKRAHAIVTELKASLEAKHSPQLCDDLNRLYDFMLHRIGQAACTCDADKTDAALAPVVNILRELRGAWATVAEKQP